MGGPFAAVMKPLANMLSPIYKNTYGLASPCRQYSALLIRPSESFALGGIGQVGRAR